MRRNLARAGLVLATHEFVKAQIVDEVRDFFVIAGTGKHRYKLHVLDRAPDSTFEASCLWLREMGALRDGDYEMLKALQQHRHAVAHELVTYVMDPDTDVDLELVRSIAEILCRLGQFWGRIVIDMNDDFDGREVADDELRSGASIFVDFLLGVTEGGAVKEP